MKLYFLRSSSNNPWFNLGLEEYFFRNLPDNSVLFYLWQNKNTVVIGRTQNAWKECRLANLEADGGKLARRSSGGGAVYHDMGNLCYTFIGKGGTYDLERQLKTILCAVKSLGIDAAFTGRNDITADGRKFSGNAFKFEKDTGLMHGTIMMDTDVTKLSSYLSVSPAKLSSKGISSVKSRVVNLIELVPDITVEKINEALRLSFIENYGEYTDLGTYGFDDRTNAIDIGCVSENAYTEGFDDFTEIKKYFDKYSSWDFRLGENPSFEITCERRLPFGCVEINMNSAKGFITDCKIYTDANDPSFAEILTEKLKGTVFGLESICGIVKDVCAPDVAEGLCEIFSEIC